MTRGDLLAILLSGALSALVAMVPAPRWVQRRRDSRRLRAVAWGQRKGELWGKRLRKLLMP